MSDLTTELPAGESSGSPTSTQIEGESGVPQAHTAENPQDAAQAEAQPVAELPKTLDYDELYELRLPELVALFYKHNIRYSPDRSRHQLVADILKFFCQQGVQISVSGVLELTLDGHHGTIRAPRYSFKNLPSDPFIHGNLIRQHGLRAGQSVSGTVRAPRDHREKGLSIDVLNTVEGLPVSEWKERKPFDLLTATFPKERIVLENDKTRSVTPRAVDIIAPIGQGQRALIVAPPRVGKTILLKDIAKAIRTTSPQTHLILLLVDERPEEVTDFRREIDCDIFSSTFDENPQRHVQVSELVSERAKRLVEMGRNVVILLDSITRLARGYNNLQSGKGRTMSGGVDTKALLKPKKFFGAARCVEEGGSLTIIATALVETQSRMDDVIFEEFKGTGNAELRLDRTLSEKRIYPAIHVLNSGTRRDDLLYHPQEFERIQVIRKQLASMPAGEAMETLIYNLRNTKSNAELLLLGLREM